MRHVIINMIAGAALLLASCGAPVPVTTPSTSPPPTPERAVQMTAATAAAVADAIGVAPPASVVPVVIDDTDIIKAWFRFNQALDVIDALVEVGIVKPKSPTALALAKGVQGVQAALTAASAAQRAGTSTSYVAALGAAHTGLGEVTALLQGVK